MYTPAAFAEADPEILHQIIRENPFALVLSAGPEGPLATHVPVVLEVGDGPAVIVGHMARANPHLEALAADSRARIVFSGPHAYVSPTWYGPGSAVPTWNYVAVHAVGRVELVRDAGVLRDMLSPMVAAFESGREPAWQFHDQPAAFQARQIKGIVGFRMEISRLEGKLKLSQNRPPGDAAGVAGALEQSPVDSDRAMASVMRRHGNAGDGG